MSRFSRHERLQRSWWTETESHLPEDTDYQLIDAAILPDELTPFEIVAEEDPTFWDAIGEWKEFIWERQIWLPLEQSCYEGLLLPLDTRMMRLVTCPEELMRSLRWFFELCPEHIKRHLAYWNYLLVRVERGRRTGNAEWRPIDPDEPSPGVQLFKWGSRFRPRNYAR